MSDSNASDCPFCYLAPERILEEAACVIAAADAFPVSRGHTLIIPRRHVTDFLDLEENELAAVYQLLRCMRAHLDAVSKPDGYNIGVNVGAVAGQTVGHAHLHLIPRYAGDVAEPMGGVRNVIPGRGSYPRAAT